MMDHTLDGSRRVLIVSPHTDDAELGCGGTISRLIASGDEVWVTAFSLAKESLPPNSAPDRLHGEFLCAMQILGVEPQRMFVHDYPVRHFSDYRQRLLDELVELRQELRPDVVFVTSSTDVHQDHQVMHNEALRCFKDNTLMCYELPWNSLSFTAQAFVVLNQEHLDRKCAALQAYKSQFELRRPYFDKELIHGWARLRGMQIRSEYAEAFEVVRVTW
jgi:LmbE family N-acetylglucosaminyl deacetylase